MKRITTLVAVMLFALIGAPLAALAADQHEGEEKDKADANAQSSEDAKKGQERAGERHDAHAAKVKAHGAADAADAKAKVEKTQGDAKAKAEQAKGSAKAGAEKAKDSAKAGAGKATGAAKAKVDADVPGLDAGAEVDEGGAAE